MSSRALAIGGRIVLILLATVGLLWPLAGSLFSTTAGAADDPGRHHRDAIGVHRRRRRAHGGDRADHRRLPRRIATGSSATGTCRTRAILAPGTSRRSARSRWTARSPVRDVLGGRRPVPGRQDRRPRQVPRSRRAHLHDHLRHRRGDLEARRGCRRDVRIVGGREHRRSGVRVLLERRGPGLGDGHPHSAHRDLAAQPKRTGPVLRGDGRRPRALRDHGSRDPRPGPHRHRHPAADRDDRARLDGSAGPGPAGPALVHPVGPDPRPFRRGAPRGAGRVRAGAGGRDRLGAGRPGGVPRLPCHVRAARGARPRPDRLHGLGVARARGAGRDSPVPGRPGVRDPREPGRGHVADRRAGAGRPVGRARPGRPGGGELPGPAHTGGDLLGRRVHLRGQDPARGRGRTPRGREQLGLQRRPGAHRAQRVPGAVRLGGGRAAGRPWGSAGWAGRRCGAFPSPRSRSAA